MHDSTTAVLIITFTFLLAGVVKGVIGMGLPTVAMGLLALVMPPVQAVVLLVVPSFVTNGWQLVAGPSFVALMNYPAASSGVSKSQRLGESQAQQAAGNMTPRDSSAFLQ